MSFYHNQNEIDVEEYDKEIIDCGENTYVKTNHLQNDEILKQIQDKEHKSISVSEFILKLFLLYDIEEETKIYFP